MPFDASRLTQRLQALAAALPQIAAARLQDGAVALLQAAEDEPDFPEDTSSLKHSGKVSTVAESGSRLAVQISFGGESPGYVHDPVEYAEDVHEGTPRMPARPYLARPMEQDGPGTLRNVARDVLEDAAAKWRTL